MSERAHVGSLYFSIERLGVTVWGAAGVPATALAICARRGHSCFSSTDQAGRSDWGHLGGRHRRGERCDYELHLYRYLNPGLPPMRDFGSPILGKFCTFVCGTLFGRIKLNELYLFLPSSF